MPERSHPDWRIYADESGTSSGPVYSIGSLAIAAESVAPFEAWFLDKKKLHGVSGEVHWAKVKKSHGLVNFGLDLLDAVLRSKVRFNVIVVHKSGYANWSADREKAFYVTYSQLLTHTARGISGSYDVFIDDRQDSYGKQEEALAIISGHMLRSVKGKGSITGVTKARSHDLIGVQAVDYFTGAVNWARALYLDPAIQIHKGKLVAITRMAELLGWDGLHYDTRPNDDFNVWHFPTGERGRPASKGLDRGRKPRYVGLDDLR